MRGNQKSGDYGWRKVGHRARFFWHATESPMTADLHLITAERSVAVITFKTSLNAAKTAKETLVR